MMGLQIHKSYSNQLDWAPRLLKTTQEGLQNSKIITNQPKSSEMGVDFTNNYPKYGKSPRKWATFVDLNHSL